MLSRDDNLYDGSYWAFRKIVGHQKVDQRHPDYNGSSYNLRILWENGDETIEPLKVFATDAPVECAWYAKEKNLLNEPGGNISIASSSVKVFSNDS